jgi:hypothetical protein
MTRNLKAFDIHNRKFKAELPTRNTNAGIAASAIRGGERNIKNKSCSSALSDQKSFGERQPTISLFCRPITAPPDAAASLYHGQSGPVHFVKIHSFLFLSRTVGLR